MRSRLSSGPDLVERRDPAAQPRARCFSVRHGAQRLTVPELRVRPLLAQAPSTLRDPLHIGQVVGVAAHSETVCAYSIQRNPPGNLPLRLGWWLA